LDIIVCVKHVPETAEAELRIDATGKGIDRTGLVFDINEWDDYALEEAVRIREKQGGTVTAITIGADDSDTTLRKCLARGADKAIRMTDPKFNDSDGYATAKILHSAIKTLHFDLILQECKRVTTARPPSAQSSQKCSKYPTPQWSKKSSLQPAQRK